MNNANQTRATLNAKYTAARINILILVALTVINVILLCFNNYTMLLFSATTPYYLVILAQLTQSSSIAVVSVCLTAAILLIYLLCFIMSKHHYGWMIVALVMFVLDTFVMAGIYLIMKDVSGVLDVMMHLYITYSLMTGILNAMKLKKMAASEPEAPVVFEGIAEEITEDAENIETIEE